MIDLPFIGGPGEWARGVVEAVLKWLIEISLRCAAMAVGWLNNITAPDLDGAWAASAEVTARRVGLSLITIALLAAIIRDTIRWGATGGIRALTRAIGVIVVTSMLTTIVVALVRFGDSVALMFGADVVANTEQSLTGLAELVTASNELMTFAPIFLILAILAVLAAAALAVELFLAASIVVVLTVFAPLLGATAVWDPEMRAARRSWQWLGVVIAAKPVVVAWFWLGTHMVAGSASLMTAALGLGLVIIAPLAPFAILRLTTRVLGEMAGAAQLSGETRSRITGRMPQGLAHPVQGAQSRWQSVSADIDAKREAIRWPATARPAAGGAATATATGGAAVPVMAMAAATRANGARRSPVAPQQGPTLAALHSHVAREPHVAPAPPPARPVTIWTPRGDHHVHGPRHQPNDHPRREQ